MSTSRDVCIIVPFFNAHDQLGPLLDTVFAQTIVDWQLILVDDASTLPLTIEADERLKSSKVRILRHAINKGPAEARNTGLACSDCAFVAFLDADDRWLPQKLALQRTAAEGRRDPGSVFCVTTTILQYTDGLSRLKPSRAKQAGEPADEYIYVHGEFAQTSSFFLGQALAKRLRFRKLRQYEDHLFFIEAMASEADYCFLPDALTIYNDDDCASRASASFDLTCGTALLNEAAGLIGQRAELAFRVRYLGTLMIKERPVATLRLVAKALRMRSIKMRFALSFTLRSFLSKRAYRRLQQRLRTTRDARS